MFDIRLSIIKITNKLTVFSKYILLIINIILKPLISIQFSIVEFKETILKYIFNYIYLPIILILSKSKELCNQ